MPYFLLALLIIAAYRISGELGLFFDFFRWVWGIMSPFFYGFLLAYVINLPCGSIQRLLAKSDSEFIAKRKRGISLIIVMIMLIFLVLLALNIIIPAIVSSIVLFIDMVPVHWESVIQLVDRFNNLDFIEWQINAESISAFAMGFLEDFSLELLAAPIGAIVGAANAVFRGAITFIASIYILIEKERCKAYIHKLLIIFGTVKFRETTDEIVGGLNMNLRRYIHTQTIGGIILGVMSIIALVIMRSPYALIIGIMLWIANYVPYFGSIIATIVAVLIVAFTQGPTMGLISAGVLLLIQQIEVNIIQPKLMSDTFSMSPLLVIISISIGGAIGGILGMIIIIPIVAVLKDVLDSVVAFYERKKFGHMLEQEGDDDDLV